MSWENYRAKFYKENGEVDRKKEMDNWFNNNSPFEPLHFKVLKSSMINSVYYAAIEQRNPTANTSRIYAAICLTKVDNKKYFNFSFKEMNEFMGPDEHKCPTGILNLLSKTDNEFANEWRNNCYNYHKKYNLIKSLPVYGRRGGKIKYIPDHDLDIGYKKNQPIVLYWQPVLTLLYTPAPQGYWTDGKHSFPTNLLMQGTVEKVKRSLLNV